jgi:hypothetical protein
MALKKLHILQDILRHNRRILCYYPGNESIVAPNQVRTAAMLVLLIIAN